MLNVFIDGNSGTTGLRIAERLALREDVKLFSLSDELRKNASARKDAINSADVVFLCLPDAAAVEAVSFVENPKVKILDSSTAHRTADGWAYGFPELGKEFRENIRNSNRVAVPGCHASGFVALCYPLIKEGILPKDYPFSCFSLTGYSGGGKKMIAEYRGENRSALLSAPRQYGISQTHKHLAEMVKVTGIKNAPIFNPVVCDFYSGMETVLPFFTEYALKKVTPEDMTEIYKEFYGGSEIIKVSAADAYLSAAEMSGKDSMKIAVGGNADRIVTAALFDNLGKGASGAAVQCMNIMCGLPETASLEL
jgi:N-acetyl-gamma-glutamyl-phosphate reductase